MGNWFDGNSMTWELAYSELGLNVIADSIIALACFAILFLLLRFARRRRNLRFQWIFLAFGISILAFGCSHLLAIWTIWFPGYGLPVAVKAIAAVSMLCTIALLVPLLPGLVNLPGPRDLSSLNTALGLEIAERRRVETETRKLHSSEPGADGHAGAWIFLADAVPQIVWTARPDGSIDYFNRRWYEYCGCPPGSLQWQEQVHPDDLPLALRQWEHARNTGQALHVEMRLRSREGGYRRHLTRVLARRDPAGEVVQWVGVATDIDGALPRAEVPDEPTGRPQAAATGKETVLLVETAPTVLRLVHSMLSDHGYRILGASSLAEARQLFAEHGARIDLLLTNLVLPQASGMELAREASARRPGLRVLFMSGPSDSANLQPGLALIQKPFTSGALARKVREVLAARPQG